MGLNAFADDPLGPHPLPSAQNAFPDFWEGGSPDVGSTHLDRTLCNAFADRTDESDVRHR